VPINQAAHPERRVATDGVRVLQEHDLRRIPENHVEVLAPRRAYLKDCFDVLGIALPRTLSNLVAAASRLEDVEDPVLFEVGVELLGPELDLAGGGSKRPRRRCRRRPARD